MLCLSLAGEDEDDALDEDDLELLEENTGANFSRRRIVRRRPGHESASPPAPSSSKHRNVIESDEEDLDDEDNFPRVQDIHNIWDDERGGGRDDDDDDVDMDDMDNFGVSTVGLRQ